MKWRVTADWRNNQSALHANLNLWHSLKEKSSKQAGKQINKQTNKQTNINNNNNNLKKDGQEKYLTAYAHRVKQQQQQQQ